MFEQTLAIIRNTFFESVRQPIVLVLLIVSTLMMIVANLTATFTMEDDQKMLIDIGMGTVFMFGALLAAFIATNVLTREIENKTVLTVISKPVSRPIFILGKYLGVALAILIASLYMCFVFLLVEHHGVMETVRVPYHIPVIVFGLSAGLIAVIVSVWCNYFYGKVFASTMILTITPLAGLAYLLSLFFTPHFGLADFSTAFDVNLWKALITLITANLVLTAVALTISTRLSQLLTIVATIGAFLLGMLSDWLFGNQVVGKMESLWLSRAAEAGETRMVTIERVINMTNGEVIRSTEEQKQAIGSLTSYAHGFGEWMTYLGGRVGHAVAPDFQVWLLSDAVTQEHVIPGSYLVKVMLYAVASIVAALSLAIILFQRREVG